jgi:arsenate reductase-like glutaredoxin family protein
MRKQMVKIFHNPKCETSRNTAALLQRGVFSNEDADVVINEKGLSV